VNKGGRPPLYSDPLKMEAKIEQYFDKRTREGKPPTIAGLCVFLGFSERHALAEYQKRKPFSATVKRARLRIEEDRADRLLEGPNTAGVIFDLTNNHGWKNPQHMKHSQDEDGEPQKVDHTVKADDAITNLLEELASLKAGSSKQG
jgi:hypothetical protein